MEHKGKNCLDWFKHHTFFFSLEITGSLQLCGVIIKTTNEPAFLFA